MTCFSLSSRRPARAAFTLVEMLVSVAVIVLMMSLFAQVFQIATGSMAKQKAIAELDQRARMVTTLLKSDLNCRTFRELSPFAPNENTSFNARLDQRRGYFYISENQVLNDLDDVLQFTIDKRLGAHPDGQVLYGRTTQVPSAGGSYTQADQPEYDDGQRALNNTGTSSMAEVVYFVRNGILYRRMLLIRQPLVPQSDGQPHDSSNNALDLSGYQTGTLNFWTDFDYSAYLQSGTGILRFNTADDLANNTASSLGLQGQRFGFSQAGQPREFVSDGSSGSVFIGRYTKGETSDTGFGYPGTTARANGNPLTNAAIADANGDGIVDQYTAGNRIAEDMLLSGVICFDIKVFDPGASAGPDGQPGFAVNTTDYLGEPLGYANDNQNYDTTGMTPTAINNEASEQGWPGSDDGTFVDLGHTGTGFYSASASSSGGNANYGAAADGYKFDTWHPLAVIGTGATSSLPPFRPMGFGADRKPGRANVDDNGNGTIDYDASGTPDVGERGWVGSDDMPIPLRSIQIRIRYLDVASDQTRDITLVIPLND